MGGWVSLWTHFSSRQKLCNLLFFCHHQVLMIMKPVGSVPTKFQGGKKEVEAVGGSDRPVHACKDRGGGYSTLGVVFFFFDPTDGWVL